ncbi:TPA: hypothetical protein R1698_001307 [Campylobacter lari]|uniref:hypothetical protein n=1 Tax=Campylobacter lari TaxID=201 RepID=UPI002152C358|nr:hypothetical protein [Campylobacter lari]MCR6565530.1 hypothetical protein [Campylobacter lari]HEC1759691.1 hypothetical protein [Campylobacter lari]
MKEELLNILNYGFTNNIKSYDELKRKYCDEICFNNIDELIKNYAELYYEEVDDLLDLSNKLLNLNEQSKIFDLIYFALSFIKQHELDVDDSLVGSEVFAYIMDSIFYAMNNHKNKIIFSKAIIVLSLDKDDIIRKLSFELTNSLSSNLPKSKIIKLYQEVWIEYELNKYYDSFIQNNHAIHNAPKEELIVLDFFETFSENTDEDFKKYIK